MADKNTFSWEDDPHWKDVKKNYDTIYARAEKETQAKLSAYLEKFKKEDEEKSRLVSEGKMTKEAYDKWRIGKEFTGKRWESMKSTITQELKNTDRKALAHVNKFIPDVFVGGYNEVGNEPLKGYSFTLIDAGTVAKLAYSNKSLLPKIEVDGKKQDRWNDKLLRAEITQGVVQGESLPKIAKRLENVFGKNSRSWLNNARTAMTMAENQGRQYSYEKMDEDGVEIEKQWIASHDKRVRQSHQHVDGETIPIKEEFSNGLMYPGDPDGDPEEVYGCRCTMISEIKGFRHKKFSKARAERQNKLELGNAIYNTRDELLEYKEASVLDGTWELEGVWKDIVTLEDYPDKAGSVKAKIEYFEKQMARYPTGSDEYWKFRKLKEATEDWAYSGKEYAELIARRDNLLQQMASLDKVGGAPVGSPFTPDAYTQTRKDNALWFTSRNGGKPAADKVFRPVTSKAWSEASAEEKRWTYEYTSSYSKYNEPLRGIVYGQSKYVGVGKVDFDDIGVSYGGFQKGQVRKQIGNITDMINKSPLPQDAWFNRGCGYNGMDKFLQCSEDLLRYGSQSELEKTLLGKSVTEYGFMSTSSMKGDGFSGNVMLNIYAPKGTKALYVEPFSAFGSGSGKNWDGKKGQSSFGSEFETIFQQGTEMRITKVERDGSGKIWIDLDVIGQGKEQR